MVEAGAVGRVVGWIRGVGEGVLEASRFSQREGIAGRPGATRAGLLPSKFIGRLKRTTLLFDLPPKSGIPRRRGRR